MGVGAATALVGAIGSIGSGKKLKKLLKNAPKYKISKEAFENQNLARSQAFGRDTAIQTQEENIEQESANAASEARAVSSNTSDLLGAIAAINQNKNQTLRGLSQDEASIKNAKMNQLYGVNNAMIDEKDKMWNYNENMPYQMQVAALRDKKRFNQELIMKGVDAQATQDAAAIQSFGQMAGSLGGMMSDERLKKEIKPTKYSGIEEVNNIEVVDYKYIHSEKPYVGVIAQQLQEIIPEAVNTDDQGYLSVDFNQVVPVLIKALQELSEEVRQLKQDQFVLKH